MDQKNVDILVSKQSRCCISDVQPLGTTTQVQQVVHYFERDLEPRHGQTFYPSQVWHVGFLVGVSWLRNILERLASHEVVVEGAPVSLGVTRGSQYAHMPLLHSKYFIIVTHSSCVSVWNVDGGSQWCHRCHARQGLSCHSCRCVQCTIAPEV
jgi:hypothetical protein